MSGSCAKFNWEVKKFIVSEGCVDIVVFNRNGNPVVNVTNHILDLGEAEQIANLIAAAPKLLEALEAAKSELENSGYHEGNETLDIINNALKAARGEK